MLIELDISYEINALNANDIKLIVYKFLFFEPLDFTSKMKVYDWNQKKFDKLLASYDNDSYISVYDLLGNIISIGSTYHKNSYKHINITIQSEIWNKIKPNDISFIINLKGFTSLYIYHHEYVYTQSEKFENNLERKNIPVDIINTIKNTPYELGVFDSKEYDTKFNPGRIQMIGFTSIVAAWKMWFGIPFFKLVPKDKLLAFPDAFKVIELENGVIHIQLYEKIEESHIENNMQIQQKFRNWLDFDTLEKTYL
jgi:hypothetical protein